MRIGTMRLSNQLAGLGSVSGYFIHDNIFFIAQRIGVDRYFNLTHERQKGYVHTNNTLVASYANGYHSFHFP